ncbi:trypsin-like [Ostrinia furnacalis]|uniref:trypsin-like n=1 Tax=Ostrinia furnacalis TaxID=93504 RepID=UPI00103A77AA|nr:trypsin-like [Ostrinia furnacalis]
MFPFVENITSNYYNCEEKKTSSSSEEDRCKSTLVNYPYSVSIQKKGAHYASGALINAQSVLTTAGVFYHVREAIKLFRVRLGSVDCKKGGIIVPIKRVEIHPSYEFGKPSFDLALIKLARPVNNTDYIKPIQLSRIKQGVVSAKFMTTYWPRLIVNGNVLPHTAKERVKYQSMRVSKQKLIPWKTCAAMMRARSAVLDETSLCLKPIATHHSVCMPDVGAPVVAEDGLWGITSGWTSKQCSIYPSPTILTRTAMPPVRTWLESVL